MDHRDLFDRSGGIGPACQIGLHDWILIQDDGRGMARRSYRGLSDRVRFLNSKEIKWENYP